jgi:hypothetical protein
VAVRPQRDRRAVLEREVGDQVIVLGGQLDHDGAQRNRLADNDRRGSSG